MSVSHGTNLGKTSSDFISLIGNDSSYGLLRVNTSTFCNVSDVSSSLDLYWTRDPTVSFPDLSRDVYVFKSLVLAPGETFVFGLNDYPYMALGYGESLFLKSDVDGAFDFVISWDVYYPYDPLNPLDPSDLDNPGDSYPIPYGQYPDDWETFNPGNPLFLEIHPSIKRACEVCVWSGGGQAALRNGSFEVRLCVDDWANGVIRWGTAPSPADPDDLDFTPEGPIPLLGVLPPRLGEVFDKNCYEPPYPGRCDEIKNDCLFCVERLINDYWWGPDSPSAECPSGWNNWGSYCESVRLMSSLETCEDCVTSVEGATAECMSGQRCMGVGNTGLIDTCICHRPEEIIGPVEGCDACPPPRCPDGFWQPWSSDLCFFSKFDCDEYLRQRILSGAVEVGSISFSSDLPNDYWTQLTGSNSGCAIINVAPRADPYIFHTQFCFGRPEYDNWPILLPPWDINYRVYNLDQDGYIIETCSYFDKSGIWKGIYTGKYSCGPASEPHRNYYTGRLRGEEDGSSSS